MLPLFRIRDMLTVAVSEPANLFLMDEIAHAAGLNVQVVAATADNIYQVIEYTFALAHADEAQEEDLTEDALAAGEVLQANDYDTVYGSWPPEKVAALLVREAVRSRASAIHLEPDEKVLRVRFLIDGCLHVVLRPPARLAAALTGAFDEMMGFSNRGSSGPNPHRSGRLMVQGRAVQLHMASLGGAFGPRIVVRLVRDDEAMRPLDKLGADFDLLARYRQTHRAAAGPGGRGRTQGRRRHHHPLQHPERSGPDPPQHLHLRGHHQLQPARGQPVLAGHLRHGGCRRRSCRASSCSRRTSWRWTAT